MTTSHQMLHRLKNDEIYPYFWKARSQNSEAVARFSFLDLESLKNKMPKSDAELERRFYGSPDSPHFSGWTLKRLDATLQNSGYANPHKVNESDAIVTVEATCRDWNESDARKAMAWRRHEKIWSFRKKLRAKAKEVRAKGKALFHAPKLNGDVWLNLGAGDEDYAGYIKVDLSGSQHIYDNIVTLNRIAESSVSKIYCNHVLEHIPPTLLRQTLTRWREVLKPGGLLLARMPDAKQAVATLHGQWVEASDEELASLGFPNYLEREPRREGKLDDTSCIQTVYGWSNTTPHSWDFINQHKTLWTPELARSRFEEVGFKIRMCRNLGTLHTAVIAEK